MQEAAELYTQTNERESASLEDQVFQEDVNASPVVVLVNSLVEQAVRQRASDIHVESGPDKVRVRCRVDGVLYTTATYDLQLLPAIIARIKILSNLDISEKRRPQDGRFSHPGGPPGIRCACFHAPHGLWRKVRDATDAEKGAAPQQARPWA